jgi:hypothetical protein
MTTIVFKDKIFAADTRSSGRAVRDVCLECGGKRHGRDSVHKAVVIRKHPGKEPAKDDTVTKFKDQVVLAMAGTGTEHWCNVIRNIMRRGGDIEQFAQDLQALLSPPDATRYVGSAMIVTKTSVFLFRPKEATDDRVKEYPIDTKQTLVLGSGGAYAYAAATVGQLTAVQAVAVAGQCDESTSQTVEWIDMSQQELKVTTEKFKDVLPLNYRP